MKIRDLIYFLAVFLLTLANSNGDRTKNKMYIKISGQAACVRRLNGTHQMGCSSARGGSTGVVHIVESENDLDFILKNGTAPPYIPVIPTNLFSNPAIINRLKTTDKISGVVVYKAGDDPDHFTHESACPNGNSGLPNTCTVSWNQFGTGVFYDDFPFTMFFVEKDEDVSSLRECFRKFNNFSFESQSLRSLCALEIDSFMFATTDTPTCLRRSNHRMNLKPINFCDPIGGDNIWSSLYPVIVNQTQQKQTKYIIVTAKIDATSLFYGIVPGAASPIVGMVTLLSTAQLLKNLLPASDYSNYDKNVLFFLLTGESYDYIGSQRILYDMENGAFPLGPGDRKDLNVAALRPENISLIVELSQLSHQGPIYAHVLENSQEVTSFIDKLQANRNDLDLQQSTGVLPPASLQTFLLKYPNISGLVLADHKEAYFNNFYNSMYDNASNVDFIYIENAYNDSMIPEGSLQKHVARIADMVAKSVYKEVTDRDYSGNINASAVMINELLYCYLENPNCKVNQVVQKRKLQEQPYNMYVGVVPHGQNFVVNLIGLTLAWLTGDVDNSWPDCWIKTKNHTYRFFNMSTALDDNTTVCYRTTINFADAVSPAFIINDYDWTSGLYSSWTESSWQNFHVRIFLKPSSAHETMTIAIGAMTMFLSMIFVYFVKSRSHILFAPPEISVPTDC